MLTDFQVDVLSYVSASLLIGVLFGGLFGLVTGGVIGVIRRRNFVGLLTGLSLASVPAAVISSLISLILALVGLALAKRGLKGGWEISDWYVNFSFIVSVVSGSVGAILACQENTRLATVGYSIAVAKEASFVLLGAIIGAAALIGTGFEGYFVLESNTRPMLHALAGFILGGSAICGWRLFAAHL